MNGDRPGAGSDRRRRPRGRPRTAEDLGGLVLRLARETGRGYSQILDELKKLGLGSICRSTVVNILKGAGLDPGPERGEHTRAEFLKVRPATLWQCHFFTHKVLTWSGWKDCFALAFIHVGTRRVFVGLCTRKPDAAWLERQAAAFLRHLAAAGVSPAGTVLFRDRDGKYAPPFDEAFRAAGGAGRKAPVRSPHMAAFIERRGRGLPVACLDRILGRPMPPALASPSSLTDRPSLGVVRRRLPAGLRRRVPTAPATGVPTGRTIRRLSCQRGQPTGKQVQSVHPFVRPGGLPWALVQTFATCS
jgi:hypothetical protein